MSARLYNQNIFVNLQILQDVRIKKQKQPLKNCITIVE